MSKSNITTNEKKLIDNLVKEYVVNKDYIETFLNQVLNAINESDKLKSLIHSVKFRLKDPEHLRDKLIRKITKAKENNSGFNISADNLLTEITDLAGIRILHLYTAQIADIHPALQNIIIDRGYQLTEKPFARTWDDESRKTFENLGIEAQGSENMYTSVHYVIESKSRLNLTCEIQVRTLSEEVWGEVDHQLNYPHKTNSLACSEQLKVLARVTSSVSRLVDSIFKTDEDFNNKPASVTKKKSTKKKTSKKKTAKKKTTKKKTTKKKTTKNK